MRTLALISVLVAAPVHAQMYKCVNERGVVQYTDKPSANCKEVDIRPSPPISGSLQPSPERNLARDEADFKRRQIERESAAAQERQGLEQRCTRARREHATLSSGLRLARINEKGEREYMEDAARERRLAEVQRELAGCP